MAVCVLHPVPQMSGLAEISYDEEENGEEDEGGVYKHGGCWDFSVERGKEELDHRGAVHEDGRYGEGDAPKAGGKENHGNGGDNAGGRDEEPFPAGENADRALSVHFIPEDDGQRRHGHDKGFGKDGEHAGDLESFFDGAVNGKGAAEKKGPPGDGAVCEEGGKDAEHGSEDGARLPMVHGFTEEKGGEEEAENGADEVGQARVENVAVIDEVDVEPPVDGDENGSQGEAPHEFSIGQVLFRGGVVCKQQAESAEEGREDDAYGEKVDGIQHGEFFPEDGKEAPEDLADEKIEGEDGHDFGSFHGCGGKIRNEE